MKKGCGHFDRLQRGFVVIDYECVQSESDLWFSPLLRSPWDWR
jgi:hypothetical protein